MTELHLWLRHEVRPTERRTPIVPSDARRLVESGVTLTVEESPQRIFPVEEYEAAGCRIAPAGSWVSAPEAAVVTGLKELPDQPGELTHRHIYFGHAYKGQPGAGALLRRFAAGGGTLLDLEYLVDDDGRRLAAFGFWAGYLGAALAVLQHRGRLATPLTPTSKEELDEILRPVAGDEEFTALVIGALGRSGRGARVAFLTAGIEATPWDLAETRDLDRGALLAHDVSAREAVDGDTGASYRLTSYCGGVPAVPNDFRYRFSWAPAGVLGALRAPARYIQDGAETVAERPWEVTRRHVVDDEAFEVYPNRDSVPFVEQYGLPDAWKPQTFVRGTLRLEGWLRAWDGVFEELKAGDDTRIAALAGELAAAYPTTDADRDRVVLAVSLDVRGDAGRSWSGSYLLDLVGDEEESAMARCVSRPLALGVRHILDGSLPAGLNRAAETAARSAQWLRELALEGVEFTLRVDE
ncbi:saccharopine dehydrogenase C-terminal domain-containing protein [Streptomyces sp. UG1]|uniref:saccharopine dehydrogenase C-terminal domain-containing protein n=1 Tax=Streptomyces sp. UG1 TaxID=3417652 RepID=UPI003CED7C94